MGSASTEPCPPVASAVAGSPSSASTSCAVSTSFAPSSQRHRISDKFPNGRVGAEVTAVCSTQNVEHARSLGADHVIDYAREDFTRNGQEYELLFNVNGSRSWSAYKRALKPDAIFVLVGGPRTPLIGPLSMVVKMRLAMLGSSRKFAFFIAKFNREDMQVLKDLIETGKVKPFVERTYPMTRIADAMTHLGAGHAKGKIVVSMG